MGLGEPEDEDRSFIFRKGHSEEKQIRTLLSKHTDLSFEPTCFENGFFLASLDGYNSGLVMEAKLVGKEVLTKAADGEIPPHHQIQVQAQLHSSEGEKVYWVGKAPKTKTGVVVEIGRDEKLIKEIREKGEEFQELLASNKPPELTAKDTLFLYNESAVALAESLVMIKKELEHIEAEYKGTEQMLKSLASHSKTQIGNVLISDVERTGHIDWTKVPEVKELPRKYLDTFRKKSSFYKKITIKRKG